MKKNCFHYTLQSHDTVIFLSLEKKSHTQFFMNKTSKFRRSSFYLELSLPSPHHFILGAKWFSRPCCTFNRDQMLRMMLRSDQNLIGEWFTCSYRCDFCSFGKHCMICSKFMEKKNNNWIVMRLCGIAWGSMRGVWGSSW